MEANDVFNYFLFPFRIRAAEIVFSNRYKKQIQKKKIKKIWGDILLNEYRHITNHKEVDIKFNIIEIKMK